MWTSVDLPDRSSGVMKAPDSWTKEVQNEYDQQCSEPVHRNWPDGHPGGADQPGAEAREGAGDALGGSGLAARGQRGNVAPGEEVPRRNGGHAVFHLREVSHLEPQGAGDRAAPGVAGAGDPGEQKEGSQPAQRGAARPRGDDQLTGVSKPRKEN